VVLLGVQGRNDFVLHPDQELTGVKVQELFFIWTDRCHVIGRLEDTGQASEIVEPKLGRSIDMVIRQPGKLLACGVTLDILPHILLDFREGSEERGVIVTMVGDKIVMAHLWLAAKKDSHLYQCALLYELRSYEHIDALKAWKHVSREEEIEGMPPRR